MFGGMLDAGKVDVWWNAGCWEGGCLVEFRLTERWMIGGMLDDGKVDDWWNVG